MVWDNAAIDACPWTRVDPPLPSTSCDSLKGYGQIPGSPFRLNPLTVTNFAPTQAMIDNGGVVIRLRWDGYNSPAGGNVGMTEWVPLLPPATNAALVLTPAAISENGGVSTVTATLARTTTAATTITVSAAAVAPAVSGDFTLTGTTLTIAAGQTASAGTVTITAVNNTTDAPDKSVAVSGTATGEFANPSAVTLTIRDDEGPPLVTLALSEPDPTKADTIPESGAGNASTVTATLNRASSAATTVTVSASGSGFTLSSARTLTIAAGGTTSAGTVTVTAVDNATDAPDRSVTVSGSASNPQGVTDPSDVTLTIADDDAAPGVTLTVASPSIPENGGSTTVSAALSHPSSAATTVTVTPVSGLYTVGSGSGATIAISAGSTTSADTATITAVDDDVDNVSNRSVMVTGTAANAQAAANSETMTVTGASLTLTDDDTARLEVSPSTSSTSRLRTTESRGTAAFTVALSSKPTGDVVLGVASSDTTEGTVSASSLTFTATTWNTAQTVTLTGVDDSPTPSNPNPFAGNRPYTVTLTVSTTSTLDDTYDGLSAVTVYAVNADNEYGLDVSAVTGQVTEAGGQATFTVALVTQPSAAVTVSVSSQDPSEGAVSPSSLTFAATAWNTAQTVTVTGADDAIDDGDVAWNVRLDPSSGDANYNGLPNVDVSVTTTDDEVTPTVALVLSSTSISESGGVSTVTATLSGASSEAVTVTVTAAPVSPAVAGDYTLSTANTLTIAAGATTSTGAVTVTAVDNNVDAADKSVTVSVTVAGGNGVTAPSSQTLTITDDDVKGFAFTPEVLEVTEGSTGVEYAVALTSEPVGGNVAVAITGNNLMLSMLSPASLTFTASDWNTAQTVTVTATAPPDDDNDAEPLSVLHEASGGGYGSVSAPLRVPLPVSVVGETAIKLDGTPVTRRTYAIEGREVEVEVTDDLEHEIVVDFAGVGSGPKLTMTISPDVSASVVARAVGDGFNLGPEGSRTVVDIDVGPGVPSSGLRICLPEREELRGAAGSRPLLLLRYDGSAWRPAGRPADAPVDGMVCADGVRSLSPVGSGYADAQLTKARSRLKSINESILPELSRAMWGSALDAVTGRLASPGASPAAEADGLAAAGEFMRANGRALEEGRASWKELLGGESFALSLGGDASSGASGAAVWGSGDWRRLSRDEDALDWSGDLFSAHLGVDGPLGERLRGGLAASWFKGDIEYTDRSGEAAIEGTHESRMTAVHPYVGWYGPDGSRLWGALGYGNGEIEITDAEVVDRFGVQKGDSEFVGAGLGGSVPVRSSGDLTLALKGSGEATRYSVDDNGEAIAAVSVDTQRLRLSAEGSRAYALSGGGTLTPSLELGGRWDGGDGATGMGVETGGAVSWADPSRGLTVEARGRALVAHRSDVKEWGLSGSVRLSPGPGGRGLSFALSPRWGASESGVGRLWDEGVAGPGSSGGDAARARVETELGYGLGVRWGEAGVLTPYGGFGHEQGEARRYRLGARLELGPSLEAGLEAGRREGAADLDSEHDVKLNLRLKW